MKKPGPIVISDKIMAKLSAAAPTRHPNEARFTPEANAALLKAREMGVTWEAVGAIFREQGWPCSRQSLARQLRTIRGGQDS